MPVQEQVWVSAAYADADPRGAAEDEARFMIAVRLKPGVSGAQAQAVADVIAQRLARAAGSEPRRLSLTPLGTRSLDPSYASVATPIATGLLLMVALVLVIACANLANLIMARGRHARGSSPSAGRSAPRADGSFAS